MRFSLRVFLPDTAQTGKFTLRFAGYENFPDTMEHAVCCPGWVDAGCDGCHVVFVCAHTADARIQPEHHTSRQRRLRYFIHCCDWRHRIWYSGGSPRTQDVPVAHPAHLFACQRRHGNRRIDSNFSSRTINFLAWFAGFWNGWRMGLRRGAGR